MIHCLEEFEKNKNVRAIALLSNIDKVFCAGDNITEFQGKTKADFAANDIYEPLNNAFGNGVATQAGQPSPSYPE